MPDARDDRSHTEGQRTEGGTRVWLTKAAVSHLLTLFMSKMTKEESERQDRTVQEFKQAFKTMETSISGECETHYTLAKLPATVARDLEQSEQIPESHYKSQAISAEETKQQLGSEDNSDQDIYHQHQEDTMRKLFCHLIV